MLGSEEQCDGRRRTQPGLVAMIWSAGETTGGSPLAEVGSQRTTNSTGFGRSRGARARLISALAPPRPSLLARATSDAKSSCG